MKVIEIKTKYILNNIFKNNNGTPCGNKSERVKRYAEHKNAEFH